MLSVATADASQRVVKRIAADNKLRTRVHDDHVDLVDEKVEVTLLKVLRQRLARAQIGGDFIL
jgi:hypothetical protein